MEADFGNGTAASALASGVGSSDGCHGAASIVGIAVGYVYGSAAPWTHDVAVNMNGSQTLSALAYAGNNGGTITPDNAKVNAFGADNTDLIKYTEGDDVLPEGKNVGDPVEGAYGWRVGIFAANGDIKDEDDEDKILAKGVSTPSTVNILAAKLGSTVTIEGDKVTITLGANQGYGQATSANYARAFAFGENYKIYIGGREDKSKDLTDLGANYGFDNSINSKAVGNVVNILGAISRTPNSAATGNIVPGSNLIVDNGWAVNAYGPVENLGDIALQNGGALNVHGGMGDIGLIVLDSSVLHVGKAADGAFDKVIKEVKEKFVYVDPVSGTRYSGSKLKLAADGCPLSGAAPVNVRLDGTTVSGNGTLELGNGSVLALQTQLAGTTYENAYAPATLHNGAILAFQSGSVINLALDGSLGSTYDIIVDVADIAGGGVVKGDSLVDFMATNPDNNTINLRTVHYNIGLYRIVDMWMLCSHRPKESMIAIGPMFCCTGTAIEFKNSAGNDEIYVGTGEYNNEANAYEGKRETGDPAYSKTGYFTR